MGQGDSGQGNQAGLNSDRNERLGKGGSFHGRQPFLRWQVLKA